MSPPFAAADFREVAEFAPAKGGDIEHRHEHAVIVPAGRLDAKTRPVNSPHNTSTIAREPLPL